MILCSSFLTFLILVICSASDTDDNREVLMAGRNRLSIQEFASAIPNHLLLGSLLEHLCFVYESNPARSRMLFKGMYLEIVWKLKGILNILPFIDQTLKYFMISLCYECFSQPETILFFPPDSHRPTFSRHEPPVTVGHQWWVQHRQTPAQSGLYGAAPRCQLLAVSTGM